jgi:hypothetical protein
VRSARAHRRPGAAGRSLVRENRRMTSPETATGRTTPADITAAVEASF